MLDRDKLQKILQKTDNINVYDLAKKMNMDVNDLLLGIRDEILPEYTKLFKKNALKIPFFTQEQTKEFFTSQIVDLGFLCQHVVKDFREVLKDKHDTLAHQSMYTVWQLNRGY